MTEHDEQHTGGTTSPPRLGLPRAAWRVVVPLVLAVAVAAGVTGWLVWPEGSSEQTTATDADVTVASAPTLREVEYGDLTPSAPVRLEMPALDVKAPVVPIQVSEDAVLDPPADVDVTGWWDGSARPGARSGQVLITGHTVHDGKGVLDRLPQAERGERIDVVTDRGRMRYEVTSTRVLSREEVADQAVDLFGQEGGNGRLVLVSCTDYVDGVYQSNVIVTGRPLGSPPAEVAGPAGPD